MSQGPPRLPEPGETVEVTHHFPLPPLSHEKPPRVCFQFGRALIFFGRARLESTAATSPPSQRLLAYAHKTPDNTVFGDVLNDDDLAFLHQQLEAGHASVSNVRLGFSRPIPHLFVTYVAGNDPFFSTPRGSVLLQAQADGASPRFMVFSRPWSSDGVVMERDPVDAVLTIVDRLTAARPKPPASARVAALAGLAADDSERSDDTFCKWLDARPHSLLESISWRLPWPGKSEEVRVELKLHEGFPSDSLAWRWGASRDFYIVSPTHQGSGRRQQDLQTETFNVNGVEVFVMRSRAGVNSMELRWPG